ncbi:MAG: hypothetical protein H6754_04665 [Candidatus Omnitrophica bacterium]|nr:hypothetical protein [Candidatus Omnitrophota bacterium]
MQQKIFYPDRYNISKILLFTMIVMVLGIGFFVNFTAIFYVVVLCVLIDIFILGALFRLHFNFEKRNITGLSPTSGIFIATLSIDDLDVEDNAKTGKSKQILLKKRNSPDMIKIQTELFSDETLTQIRSIIKNKFILGG